VKVYTESLIKMAFPKFFATCLVAIFWITFAEVNGSTFLNPSYVKNRVRKGKKSERKNMRDEIDFTKKILIADIFSFLNRSKHLGRWSSNFIWTTCE